MLSSQQLTQLGSSLAKLGARRLVILGVAGILVMSVVGLAAYFLGRPAMQPIYTGLSAQDVTRMTAALAEAGITFDVNEQRSAVLVPFGQTARARTLLAQKGLPASSRAGYELFDQMGSMGLTSFMQEVTRIRALEGEIARTIQAVDGVAAARVHLVLPDPGSFRRERREASASVLIRTDERWQGAAAQAVRHIVAAAVPGMKIEQVNLASADGRLLASGGDERSLGTHKLNELERTMAAELEQRAARTLTSALGARNYTISATVRLDVDRQQVNETVYDPKSRVERSVRVVKQSGSSEDGSGKANVGVEANIPREDAGQSDGEKRRQREDRREELVNYELNTKTVQTVREGYRILELAVAVVVNRKHLSESLGPDATPELLRARIAELKRLVVAATGASDERKDKVEISAVDFSANGNDLGPVPGPSVVDHLVMNTGTFINALALFGVAFLVIWFGVRPATRILGEQQQRLSSSSSEVPVLGSSEPGLGLPAPSQSAYGDGASAVGSDQPGRTGGSRAITSRHGRGAAIRERLDGLVDEDPSEVTRVFKQWIGEAKSA